MSNLRTILIGVASVALLAPAGAQTIDPAQERFQPPKSVQDTRDHDQRGINVFEVPKVAGATYDEAFAVAKQKDWPGYLGAPRVASAALGRHIWTSFSGAALKTTLEILNGTDPKTYPRYLSYLVKNPLYQDWIRSANDRDSTLAEKQRSWKAKRDGS